mmetsp:Transcript_37184/g.75886  ORF Transcript_37184/g.75886 Transcript_37184/m.75886 type:complete len:87 (+) Transcript_37184:1773-2033(+)
MIGTADLCATWWLLWKWLVGKIFFVVVEFDLMPIELLTGDEIPLATKAWMAVLPLERSNVRLVVASIMVNVVELAMERYCCGYCAE